ncbi:caspase family protein [Pseudotabrizicola sp.]|uniref:caspase family protein n=1 Tax=Pseudotabrizicola sp. TaxID=2939647 RepID=UPI002721E90F|nr:caspase family protein [Pseudotabrizicola sp.]MDO8881534.1 caspase family protein [Pseudotabrizicola sp.]
MRRLLIGFVVTLLAFAANAAPERRALVIGNDTYESLPILKKARNDAQAVAASLHDLGFGVATLTDADRRAMTRAVSDLASAVQPGDEVLFYFAGHGVEVKGRNYLLPADAPTVRPGDEAFLTAESLAVDDILFTLQSRGARVTVLILDACRDNPFPRDGMRSAGGARGLAPIAAPEGAFILFSAGTGQSALDALSSGDADPNSVFTRALLPLLAAPGLPLQEMARALKSQVEETAATINHKQRPAYYDELTGDFVLNAGALVKAAPGVALPPPVPAVAALPAPVAAAVVVPTWRVKAGVSQGFMNARTGPGTMHAILFRITERSGGLTLAECRKSDPGGGRGDWCLVSFDGKQGWVSKIGLEQE